MDWQKSADGLYKFLKEKSSQVVDAEKQVRSNISDTIGGAYDAFGRGLGGYLESDQQLTPQSDAERVGRNIGQLDTNLTMTGNSLGPLGMGPALIGATALKIPKIVPKVVAKVLPKGLTMLGESEARLIPELFDKFKRTGNISMDEHEKVIDMTKKHLNIPQKQMRGRTTLDILEELSSLMDKNQVYQYEELPKKKVR